MRQKFSTPLQASLFSCILAAGCTVANHAMIYVAKQTGCCYHGDRVLYKTLFGKTGVHQHRVTQKKSEHFPSSVVGLLRRCPSRKPPSCHRYAQRVTVVAKAREDLPQHPLVALGAGNVRGWLAHLAHARAKIGPALATQVAEAHKGPSCASQPPLQGSVWYHNKKGLTQLCMCTYVHHDPTCPCFFRWLQPCLEFW